MSVLGLRVMQAYVPLHCGPSESVSTMQQQALSVPHTKNHSPPNWNFSVFPLKKEVRSITMKKSIAEPVRMKRRN